MSSTSVSGKKWEFKKYNNSDVQQLIENYSLSEIVAKLLSIRKTSIDNINLFLKPTIKNLMPNPFIIKDMNVAVERTYKAIVNKDIIT